MIRNDQSYPLSCEEPSLMKPQARPALDALQRCCLALVLLSVTVGVAPPPPAVAASLLPGFSESLVVGGVEKPTALAFTPDGRLLIATQPGPLYVFQNGNLTEALNLAPILCTDVERGLMGVAVDPNFAANNFIYLYYTFNKFGSPNPCPTGASNPTPVNRASRFTLPPSNVILTSTEVVLVDNIPQIGGFHNGGDLHFGADGLLYISVGDATKASYARTLENLAGKMLRIAPNGSIPASNPYASDPASRRCGDPAGVPPGAGPCKEILAHGLRNPFRFAFRPGTNQFFINDVGQDTWEEINEGQIGADYGWACREGAHPYANASPDRCDPPPPNMIDPIFEYMHGVQIPGTSSPANCNAITGSVFVPDGLWPGYDGVYLFSDYVCDSIFQLRPDGSGGYTAQDFASGMNGPIHLTFGPYNNTQALYYSVRHEDAVRRIIFAEALNAVISAAPTYGNTPLMVTFSAAGSSGPSGHPLSFEWDFGDGITTTTSLTTTTHTYTNAGVFTATLVVRDTVSSQASAPATIRIYPGNTPPVPKITSPLTTTLFSVGQTITLTGSVTDTQDAPSAVNLHWNVLLHHVDVLNPGGAHTHPWFSTPPLTSTTGVITNTTSMPAPEGMRATDLSFVEVQLIATDSLGLSATITQAVQPHRVSVTFATQPNGLQLTLNDGVITGTQTVTSWQNYDLNVVAITPQADGLGQMWAFSQWLDGGPAARIITTPPSAITYTAVYAPARFVWLPIVFK
jgi:glucose/arabinose dehydrogenase/PKD repeat protein